MVDSVVKTCDEGFKKKEFVSCCLFHDLYEEAKSEYVVLFGSDSVILPSFGDKLRSLLNSLGTSDKFLIVGHRLVIRESGEVCSLCRKFPASLSDVFR